MEDQRGRQTVFALLLSCRGITILLLNALGYIRCLFRVNRANIETRQITYLVVTAAGNEGGNALCETINSNH